MLNKLWLSKKDYDYIYSRVPRLCVDLVIKGKAGVLLGFRDIEPEKNTWHLPGGRVFLKESLEQAAQRIAREETGIKIKILKFLGFMEFPEEKQNGKLRHSVSLVFLAKPVSRKLMGSWQAKRMEFFKKLPKNSHKAHGDFLKKVKVIK